MDYDRNTEDNWERPEYLHLNESLVDAINDGDMDEIVLELSYQKRTETTDDISNHFVVRGFWLHQKSRLMELYGNAARIGAAGGIAGEIQACINDLDDHFAKTLISNNETYKYEKLSGDDLFREAISSSVEAARFVMMIDQDNLRSPRELLDTVALQHNMLIHELSRVQNEINTNYWGAGTTLADRTLSVTESAIEAVDRELTENIVGAVSRSPL